MSSSPQPKVAVVAATGAAVRKQLEFYMSDANLSRDSFFRWEVQKAEDEALTIDLLLKCNRLKAMGVTHEDLIKAAKQSKLLKLVRNGTAVRRKTSINFATQPSDDCVVLATGLSSEADTSSLSNEQQLEDENVINQPSVSIIDYLSQRLRQYGGVKYIKLPRFKTSGAIRGFAFIEFDDKESVQRALQDLGPTERDLPSLITPSPVSCKLEKKGKQIKAAINQEAGWTPKLASNAPLSTTERLARQHVWRCCSRRSKQALATYRRLCSVGYRLPNPLEAEYRAITDGPKQPQQIHLPNSIIAPLSEGDHCSISQMRLLPLSDWLCWQPRFYSWLKAWMERMNAKATKLMAAAERKQRLVNSASIATPMELSFPSKVDDSQKMEEEIDKRFTYLPDDFTSGTIVEIYWPLSMSVDDSDGPSGSSVALIDPRLRTRRIRGSIERLFLQPRGLLPSVVHFDGNPSEELLSQLPSLLQLPTNEAVQHRLQSTSFVRCFVRFVDPNAAQCFAEQLCNVPVGLDYPEIAPLQIGFLLDETRERVYCQAILASKIGVRERRRKMQARRRARQKPPLNDSSLALAQAQPASVKHFAHITKPKRIVFDEEEQPLKQDVNNSQATSKRIVFDE